MQHTCFGYLHPHTSKHSCIHIRQAYTRASSRVAKTHRIPYLYRSFSAKVTYIRRGSYESSPPCSHVLACMCTGMKIMTYIHGWVVLAVGTGAGKIFKYNFSTDTLTYIHSDVYIHTDIHTCAIHTYTLIHIHLQQVLAVRNGGGKIFIYIVSTSTDSHIHTYIHDGIYIHTDIHTCAADSSSGKWRRQDVDIQLLCWHTTSPSTLSCTHTHRYIHAHGHTYMCNRYRVGPIEWIKFHIWDMTTICLKHIWGAYRVATTHWMP